MNVSKWVLIGLSMACAVGTFMSAEATPSPASASLMAKASSSAGTNYGAEKAIDGDESTCWSPSQEEWLARKPMWLEVDLGQEREIGHAFITELAGGSYPHIQNFRIEYKQGDAWKCVYEGAEIFGRRVYDFKPVKARVFRMTFTKVLRYPQKINEFHLYAPGKLPEAALEAKRHEAETAKRLEWFKAAKFGMMIHWGPYAVAGGEWDGKPVKGIGEWIMRRANDDKGIPLKEYEKMAAQFNPTKFNADEWVQLAVDAGMKYIVITSKHHDGFAMFHSSVDKYNIFDYTPWKRDPMKELAEACDKKGIKLGFYYSQSQDWHHPYGAGNALDYPPSNKSIEDFSKYLSEKALPQVRELLTNYGPVALIWFDTPKNLPAEWAGRFHDTIRSLQPETLINSRLGPGGYQDYLSRNDNDIPPTLIPGTWETPATLNHTWGYKKNDNNWKSPDDILFKLVDITSKGGNYLLNVGPDAEGVIPQASQDNLRKIGAWLKVNGEAVYGTGYTPFGDELGSYDPVKKDKAGFPVFNAKTAWRCTTKPGKLYIHIFQWPGAKFELSDIKDKVAKAYFLNDRTKLLSFSQEADKLIVQLPATAPDPMASVLCLEVSRWMSVSTAARRAAFARDWRRAGAGKALSSSSRFVIWAVCMAAAFASSRIASIFAISAVLPVSFTMPTVHCREEVAPISGRCA